MRVFQLILIIFCCGLSALAAEFETIRFSSEDSLQITADLYLVHSPQAPFIVLFHQAGFSRGEYREIAPHLNKLGFNAMAVDQRSGDRARGVINETAARASAAGKGSSYLDALQDIRAAAHYARRHHAQGKLILWGSSYSAALVLKLAGDEPELADGVLAFAPGEYFVRFGKSKDFIARSAAGITVPVFITSAKKEKVRWFPIYQAIPDGQKNYFLPKTEGIHGSRALWSTTPEQAEYWKAVEKFLKIVSGH